MEPNTDITKSDWKILVFDDTGRVLINTIQRNMTQEQINTWREQHEDESWASVEIRKTS